MTSSATPDFDAVAFATRARRFVQSHRWLPPSCDDLVQEMCAIALASRSASLNLVYCYLRAVDRVYPRYMHRGKRTRTPVLTVPTPTYNENVSCVVEAIETMYQHLPAQGALRAMMILVELYGFTQHEVGQLFGVSSSRICQLLKASPEAPFQGEVDD